MRKAQREAGRCNPFTKVVESDDLSKLDDGLHYDTKGQLELGARFARACLALIEKPGTWHGDE